jgi:Fe-S oxidoreductase
MKAVLVAVSAKHIHKTLAPWCLKAYAEAEGFEGEIVISEHTINDLAEKMVASVYKEKPDVLGFSCYIWNIEMVSQVGAALKKLLPDCRVILGGPEVSFEEDLSAFPFADGIIAGAGEKVFFEILQNGGNPMMPVMADETPPAFCDLPSPYTREYFDSLLKSHLVYYETTRGCPFRCAYCLSALSGAVESLPLERVFKELQAFADRNVRCVKFVDRTFNADKARALEILKFVGNLETETCFHFEVAPDLFDEKLLNALESLPPGRVQLEMGIQSVHEETLLACSRKTDVEKAFENILRISKSGRVHTHVDLIAGLPYETLESFIPAIDRCLEAEPHAVQLGFLKLLKGSKLRKEKEKYGYIAFDTPPYELMQSNTLSYDDMRELKAVEDLLDKYHNSGMFPRAVRYGMALFGGGYAFFKAFAAFLGDGAKPKTSLKEAYRLLLEFLCANGDAEYARHLVRWDILAHDEKAVMPEGLERERHKETEFRYRARRGEVSIEYFPYDNTVRVFESKNHHPVTGELLLIEERLQ